MHVSSSGNAAAEARAGGADEETALLYGMLSGSIEVLTEQIGGGIPGLNKGTLDDWLMGMAQSNTGRAALKHLVNALGEGAEEFVSEIAGAYLAQMWNGDEPDFWQTLGDAFYAGLVGTLTSACMSVPGDLAELNDAHTVDNALNAMRNGKALSGTQLADANRAMQKLIGKDGSESPWSRIPAREWEDTKSWYFDNYFPQMADLTGHTGDLSGIDTSNIIFLPTGDELKALAKANSDANAASSPAVNNAAAAQNGQPDLSNVIFFPTGDEMKALEKANVDTNAASSPAANNAAAAQNDQRDLSNVFFFPTRDHLEMWAKRDADANAASSPAANNAATAQNNRPDFSNLISPPMFDNQTVAQNSQANASETTPQANPLAATDPNAIPFPTENNATAAQNSPFDLSGATFLLTGNGITANQNSGKTAGKNFQQANPLHNTEGRNALSSQGFERGMDVQEREVEIRDVEREERGGGIEQESNTLPKEEKDGILSEQRESNIPVTQNAMLSVSVPASFRPNERLRIRVKEECQRALLRVKSLPLGTEAMMLFRMDMVPIKNGIFVGEPEAGNVTIMRPRKSSF